MRSVHPQETERNCKELAKPAKRLELVFWPTQHGTATPWVGMRYDRSPAGEVVTAKTADPIDAAADLIDLAARTGYPVVMPAYLRDQLIARWRMEGITLYGQGIGREWCSNVYVRNGWDAAYTADVQPFLFRAWPELAGVGE